MLVKPDKSVYDYNQMNRGWFFSPIFHGSDPGAALWNRDPEEGDVG